MDVDTRMAENPPAENIVEPRVEVDLVLVDVLKEFLRAENFGNANQLRDKWENWSLRTDFIFTLNGIKSIESEAASLLCLTLWTPN